MTFRGFTDLIIIKRQQHMEKFYRVAFKAQLVKFALAFKADCQIDVFWKKGEKIAQSSKVPFTNAASYFNETLNINCNMVFDVQAKSFKPKITKFQIILYTEKGNKKVGEIHFDVAGYLNERHKIPKEYDPLLEKCPDKNAKLSFKLSANIEQQISPDLISNSSVNTINVETIIVNNNPLTSSPRKEQPPKVTMKQPPRPPASKEQKDKRISSATSLEGTVTSSHPPQPLQKENVGDLSKALQLQNKKIRQQLKNKQKLIKQNEELKRKIKNEEYDSINELKEKIENGRKELQKLQQGIKKQAALQKEVKTIEEQIFRCKFQIMSAFNYANQRGGGKLMFEMQEACGLTE